MIRDYRKKILKNLKRKNLFALSFLSVITIISYLFIINSIKRIDKDGYIINLSGKQRFLSVNVALYAMQFVHYSNPQNKDLLRSNLLNNTKNMESVHNYLVHDLLSMTTYYHSPEIDSLYFNAPVFLDKKVYNFLNEAYLLVAAKDTEITDDNPHLLYLLSFSNDLLASLNLIVYQYQKENETRILNFNFKITGLTFSLILMYLFVGIFIFRPVTKQINRSLIDLENKETELQQINEANTAATIEAQESELQRIASDLHDGLMQTLTVISYKFDTAGKNHNQEQEKYFNETKLLIDSAIAETRNIAHRILPPILNQFGIIPALKALSEQVNDKCKINVVFQTYELTGRLNNKVELALYRIAQEALSNAIKHAEARNIKIQLIRHPGLLVLIIEDDGKGFDVSVKSAANSMGLVNIQERTNMLHGNLIINSSPEMGTEIMVEIPFSDKSEIS